TIPFLNCKTHSKEQCWHLALLFRLGVALSSDPSWFNIFLIINLSERVKVGQVFRCTNYGFISWFCDKYIIFFLKIAPSSLFVG
ncbi:unnamed protein product, partial [Callosobruchus maculatus]